jgi:hypothetical protein
VVIPKSNCLIINNELKPAVSVLSFSGNFFVKTALKPKTGLFRKATPIGKSYAKPYLEYYFLNQIINKGKKAG